MWLVGRTQYQLAEEQPHNNSLVHLLSEAGRTHVISETLAG
jgi:hypothetical protein